MSATKLTRILDYDTLYKILCAMTLKNNVSQHIAIATAQMYELSIGIYTHVLATYHYMLFRHC